MTSMVRHSGLRALATVARLGILLFAILSLVTISPGQLARDIASRTLRFAVEETPANLLLSKLVGIAAVCLGVLFVIGIVVAVFTGLRELGDTPLAEPVKQAFLIIVGCLAFAVSVPVAILWATSDAGFSKLSLFVVALLIILGVGWLARPAFERGKWEPKATYWGLVLGVPATIVAAVLGFA